MLTARRAASAAIATLLCGTGVSLVAVPALAAAPAVAPTSACSTQAGEEGLVPVLQLHVPVAAAWSGQDVPYSFDNTAALAQGFDRVGYCMETVAGGQSQWAWSAMEAFTDDASQLGLHTKSGDLTRQRVDDLTVASNVASVRTGSGMTGYLEMWPNSYDMTGSRQVAGASPAAYDVDDTPTTGGYGAFQVSSVGDQPDSATAPSTVFAVNHFTDTGSVPLDVGIGQPATGSPDYTFAQNAGDYSERTLTVYARAATVDLTAAPSDRQLYPRDAAGGADVAVTGTVTDPSVDSVRLTVTSQGQSTVQEQPGSSFSFSPRIEAGLHDYELRLETVTGGVARTVGHWTHVVSGDVYLVQGQSNAESGPYTTTGSTVAESPFIRSYGTNAPEAELSGADRAWNYAAGDRFFDMASVGQWPLEMAHDLIRTEQVPIAIINGAHGGAAISFFQRNDSAPDDLGTNYGRTRQRLVAAGVMDHLSGVLWYQGETENENAAVHITGFRSLLSDWRDDLGGARSDAPPYYVFQIRTSGCGSVAGVGLREAQRQLGVTDGVTVLSTTAVPGHDGCHFAWPGYRLLGDQVADTLRRDLFGGPSAGVAAPNPLSAQFTTRVGDSIVVQLASTTDDLNVDEGAASDFRLDGSTATVTGVRYLSGGRLEFTLSRPAPEATGLSYYGHLGDGPVITTSRGVGLLAFGALPVANPSVQHRALQTIVDRLAALDDTAGQLADAGDLTQAQRGHVADVTEQATQDVVAAIAADDSSDRATELSHLLNSLGLVRDLRDWVEQTGAPGPVLGQLRDRVADLQGRLEDVTATALGVTVSTVPLEAQAVPGQALAGTVRIASEAAVLTHVSADVAVPGWDVDDALATADGVTPGGAVDLPFTATVPSRQGPGPVSATVAVTFTTNQGTFTLHATDSWVTVSSRISLENLTSEQATGDPGDRIVVTAEVVNGSDSAVTGQLVVGAPDGWAQQAPSAPVTLAAGERRTVTVPMTVPLDVVAGSLDVPVTFRRAGVALASATTPIAVQLATPPTGDVVDHVDFGNGPSETAHALQAAPSSGTNVEAGLTRRYSATVPGSWFSAQVAVPAGEPFVLRNIETFDGARSKRYDVYVDGTLVKTQRLTRAASGAGTQVYDALVDDPAVLADDGSVRIRFEYPTDASGFFDPSIADLWVLALPEDTQAPDVSATVTSERPGDAGWQRGAATVTVSAVDNRDAAPVIQTGQDAGWQDYTGPLTVTGEGKRTIAFRATDGVGNRSQGTVPVWIDATPPTTDVAVRPDAGQAEADRATLVFTAADALSGVASTSYRIDGGTWTGLGPNPVAVTGFGSHQVEFRSTDVAGNEEPVRRTAVTLDDVSTVAAIVVPQVTGVAAFGSTLSATAGTWNTKGLSFAFQWLRDGSPVTGATGATYLLGVGDVGKRVSVQVTATKSGLAPGVSTSSATPPVAKAASSVRVTVDRTKIRAGEQVKVAAVVSAPGANPTGRAEFVVDGKVLKTVALSAGKATASVVIKGRGKHTVVVRYLGSPTVAASVSAPRTIKAT